MYYDKWWKSQGRESEETACLSSKSSSQETVANALGVVNIVPHDTPYGTPCDWPNWLRPGHRLWEPRDPALCGW